MIITVNEEQIDFTLENEQNLEEVVEALMRWLHGSGYSATTAMRDGVPIDLADSELLRGIAIAEVGHLEITAAPSADPGVSAAEIERERTDPKGELRATGKALMGSIEQLREVPVLLQTGKDREAMGAVIRFTELSAKLIRLFPAVRTALGIDLERLEIGGALFADFYADFNTVLSELVDAFASGDSVLMGDLLEYEIAPRLEKLKEFIDLILIPS